MFLPVKRYAFLTQEELARALQVLQRHMAHCRLVRNTRGDYRLVPAGRGQGVRIRRMAMLGECGAVLSDGFEVCFLRA